MPVVDGRRPVSTLVRDGLHSGAWQWALVNSVPRGGQPVDVRRLGLRVPSEAADPVVQVVDRDEEDVGAVRGGRRNRPKQSGHDNEAIHPLPPMRSAPRVGERARAPARACARLHAARPPKVL